ncbi:helix-turn-helix domain-containing protein [Streptomyces sp. NPDC059468]|uniref:helix-turn-helix domain-containing protein n=1 Tax=unclassified Streptomyces TaxID=2593676 RepID=UPI00368C29AD
MTDDGIADTLAAMGPRLRTARERHGATLTGVSRATGISLSTLSRIETGRRKPTLEVLLQLAKAYDVSLDELAGTAPAAAAGPRTPAPQRSGNDKTVLPLTRYVGGLHAHKHVVLSHPCVHQRRPTHPDTLTCAFATSRTSPIFQGLIRDEEVVGSNPATPTVQYQARGRGAGLLSGLWLYACVTT